MELERVRLAQDLEAQATQYQTDSMFADPADMPTKVERDGKGRPYVVPPSGGKRKAYARCTTFVGCLEDQYNVHLWQQRMTAIGLADRPDLLLSVSAHRDDRDELNDLVERAREAAKANTGATTGTALHKLCELHDLGENVRPTAAYADDLKAYIDATSIFEMVSVEEFCVYDPYQIGGTPDRVIKFMGRYYIADVKTGTIDFGQLKFAMQFAVYSRSTPYDYRRNPKEGIAISGADSLQLRGSWPGEIDQSRALLIHLPQGEGTCSIYWVDIAAGWDAVQIAAAVRAWRNRKNLITPFDLAAARTAARIVEAETVEELYKIYDEFVASGRDGSMILDECKLRKMHLQRKARHKRELVEMKKTGKPV